MSKKDRICFYIHLHLSHTELLAVSVLHLSSLEHRLSLLLECLEGFVAVLSVNNALVHLGLLLGASPGNSLESSSDSNGATLADLLGETNGLSKSDLASLWQNVRGIALILGNDLNEAVGDAKEVSLGGGDAATSEDQIAGTAETNQSGETVGASSSGEDAEAGFGQTNDGVGGKDAEVGGQGEFETATEGDGGYGGDGRNREAGEGSECAVEVGQELFGTVKLNVSISGFSYAAVVGASSREQRTLAW